MGRAVWFGITLLGAVVMLFGVVASGPLEDIAAATGKTVFVLVSEPGAAGIDAARAMIGQVMGTVTTAKLIEVNRADAANADFVAQYRLLAAPVPLVMVIAPNGALGGGMPTAQATPEMIAKLIPTPKKAEALKALQAGKAVFVTASRKGMAAESGVMSACAAACGQMAGKSAAVQIDLDDPAEAPFIQELKLKPEAAQPTTVVINTQGQITGAFNGPVEVGNLVRAATKKAGGCCPGGASSSSGCGPTKK
ncbi:MAG: hypothetical protein GYA46_12455 [candidate division Zixibacteria bacterium]|nr:hypothetical protein [candidate division Zixibacteria bacterium]